MHTIVYGATDTFEQHTQPKEIDAMRLISKKNMLFFLLPGALFMTIFIVYPIIRMAYDSLFNITVTGNNGYIGLGNYIKAFTASGITKQIRNTVLYVLVAVSVELLLGIVVALLFEKEYRGSKIIRSLFITPLMIAPLVAGLLWKLMLSANFGIVNQLLWKIGILEQTTDILWLASSDWSLLACCIADIWLTTPFMMMMVLTGLQGLDNDMIEAASIDGANALQKIIKIKLPNIKPILLTALSIRIIDAARTFDIIWAMTEGGPNKASETLSIVIYKTLTRYNQTGYASAMAIIFIIILVVFTLVCMQSMWNPKKKMQ